MNLLAQLAGELWAVLVVVARAAPYVAAYIGVILATLLVWTGLMRLLRPARHLAARKTVTFGDETAVSPNRIASILSVVLIFVFWAAFTGSRLLPDALHAPAAFLGTGEFTYTITTPTGETGDASVRVLVHPAGESPDAPQIDPGTGIARNDATAIPVYRSQLLRVDENDLMGRAEDTVITAVDGQPIAPGQSVNVDFGRVAMSERGTLNIIPSKGLQMEPIWLPAPEAVWARLGEIASAGYRNATLAEHLGYSLFRVIVGFALGALVGIPLGYAMGLSHWFRGWFDPIVEFMRPVPPLALIPLVIIWAGIGETGKIILLFLAALWIMAIAARAGVSGVRISKVHAAYSLGASKWQIMRHVIMPNSLPEIFTGARVAMGVCWGTVVAAELVAAEQGVGMMIMVASRFQSTDIVLMGIIVIGVIGFAIDLLIRWAERLLVPWKGKG